ncbi:MAG: flagellar protein FlaG [Planctomycetota bacterium]
MSSIQSNVATQVGTAINPRPMSQENREQTHDVDVQKSLAEATVAERPVRADDVRTAAAELKQVIEISSGNQLNFDIYDETEQLYAEVKDRSSGEVVKTIPAQEVMELRKRIGEMVGMVLDERV